VNENAEYDRRKCGIAFGMNEKGRSPEIRDQRSERNYGGTFRREKLEWNEILRIDQCEPCGYDCDVDRIPGLAGKRDLRWKTLENFVDPLED
jgi:hypothetical protein